MSDKIQSRSQRNKHNKKNNSRSDLVLKLSIGLLVLAIFILLLELIYPGSNGANENDLALDTQKSESSVTIQETESQETSESVESSESKESESSESTESVESEVREVASNDPNVIKAYAGEWGPIGTTQTGTHVTNYNDGSADRVEIKQATSQATGISEGDMIEYWVGNDGDQRVTATIMQVSTGRFYKSYLTWIDGEGWQVTRYDEIKEIIQ